MKIDTQLLSEASEALPEQAPSLITGTVVTVPENQATVLNLEATDDDGDTEGNGLTYHLSGGTDEGAFSIDSITGVLSFDTPPDFEKPVDGDGDNIYQVEVTVTDSTGLSDAQLLGVTVNDTTESRTELDIGLYDANSDTLLISINDSEQILASEVTGKELTIAALVPEDSVYFGQVESMFLNLNNSQTTKSENVQPYALFGDKHGDFREGNIPMGENTITFELYSKNNLGGNLLDMVTLDFTIT